MPAASRRRRSGRSRYRSYDLATAPTVRQRDLAREARAAIAARPLTIVALTGLTLGTAGYLIGRARCP